MPYNVLIVDDQKEISRLLRSALETFERGLAVREAPSGEEALLEASRTNFELLVADFRLPGITGVELMRKIRMRHPDIKVILISGISEPRTRDEIARSGADACFFKPVPMGDFLDTVERLLGMERTIVAPGAGDEKATLAPDRKTLADQLVNLRKTTHASTVVLINDRGRVVAQAGELPDPAKEVPLVSALMAAYSAVQKVALTVEHNPAASLSVFRGEKVDYLFAPVGMVHALLIAGKGIAANDTLSKNVAALSVAQPEMEYSLQSIGGTGALSPAVVEAYEAANAAKPAQAERVVEEESPTDITDLFSALDNKKVDLDAFWNEAVEKGPGFTLKDTLTFEEAAKLGLAPGEE